MTVDLQADKTITNRASAQVAGPQVNGTATFTEYDVDGYKYVHIRLELSGDPSVLTPGKHAVHIHEKATCNGNVLFERDLDPQTLRAEVRFSKAELMV